MTTPTAPRHLLPLGVVLQPHRRAAEESAKLLRSSGRSDSRAAQRSPAGRLVLPRRPPCALPPASVCSSSGRLLRPRWPPSPPPQLPTPSGTRSGRRRPASPLGRLDSGEWTLDAPCRRRLRRRRRSMSGRARAAAARPRRRGKQLPDARVQGWGDGMRIEANVFVIRPILSPCSNGPLQIVFEPVRWKDSGQSTGPRVSVGSPSSPSSSSGSPSRSRRLVVPRPRSRELRPPPIRSSQIDRSTATAMEAHHASRGRRTVRFPSLPLISTVFETGWCADPCPRYF